MTDIPKAFTKMFWGLFLIFIDFNIIQYDILPDFVGYFFIVSALSDLQSLTSFFQKAKMIAIILGILSIPGYFFGEINLSEGFVPSPTTIFFLIASSIVTFIGIALMYFFLQGCAELANQHNQPELAETTSNYLTIFIMISLATVILSSFTLNITETTALSLVTIGAVASLIIHIMILYLIRRYRNTFKNIQA